jgi:hypothetical protein
MEEWLVGYHVVVVVAAVSRSTRGMFSCLCAKWTMALDKSMRFCLRVFLCRLVGYPHSLWDNVQQVSWLMVVVVMVSVVVVMVSVALFRRARSTALLSAMPSWRRRGVVSVSSVRLPGNFTAQART